MDHTRLLFQKVIAKIQKVIGHRAQLGPTLTANRGFSWPLEVPMNVLLTRVFRRGIAHGQHLRRMRSTLCLVTLLIVLPALAEAQFINSPFDTGLTSLQSLFTGTVAKVASLIAIVIGG